MTLPRSRVKWRASLRGYSEKVTQHDQKTGNKHIDLEFPHPRQHPVALSQRLHNHSLKPSEVACFSSEKVTQYDQKTKNEPNCLEFPHSRQPPTERLQLPPWTQNGELLLHSNADKTVVKSRYTYPSDTQGKIGSKCQEKLHAIRRATNTSPHQSGATRIRSQIQ